MPKIDLEHHGVVEGPTMHYTPDSRGVGHVYYKCMLKNKDNIAQIYGPTGERETYGELLERCVRTAIALRNRGVGYGDFVSICTKNYLDSAVPVLSSLFIGAIMAAVDYELTVNDVKHLLAQAVPKVIFVIPECVDMVEQALNSIGANTEIVVFGNTSKHTPFSDFLKPNAEENNFKPVEARNLLDTALMFFTSGTTGIPKGILHNHSSILHQHHNMISADFHLEMLLEYTSPYWTVYYNFLGCAIIMGNTRLLYPDFDKRDPWHYLNYNVTGIFLATTEALTMYKTKKPIDVELDCLKSIIIGGNVLNENQMNNIRSLFPEASVYLAYGQTEIPGPLLMFRSSNVDTPELLARKPTSVGTALSGISYKVVDPKTEEVLGPNQQGELRVKPVFPIGGYYNVDQSILWDSDGWVKTGDLAYYDEEHCFYVVGRLKDMFKYKCFRIIPTVIQDVILMHPAIDRVMVIGIPHETDGEHPMAVVVLKAGHENVTSQEIEQHVADRLYDSHRLRAGVKFVKGFPMTGTGKIQRSKLRDLILRGYM